MKPHSLNYENRISLCPHSLTENSVFNTDISLHVLCHVLTSSFVSVENQDSDDVCIDGLKFYGTPKLAIAETPFATCNMSAHTWAESSQVYKYKKNTYSYVPNMQGRVQSRFEFHFQHSVGCCKDIDFSQYNADRWFMGGNRRVFSINGTFRP